MIKRNELVAYALDFTSYLISRVEGVDSVILFGSVAKDEFDDESDVDIFVNSKDKKMENAVKKSVDSYCLTEKYKRWEAKGINNTISCITGDIDSEGWADLKRGIINTGIVLCGKYESNVDNLKQHMLFSLKPVKPESKRVTVHKKLFGFSVRKKKYPGLVRKYDGRVLGSNVFIVPLEHCMNLKRYLHEKKVAFVIYEIWKE